MKIPHNRIFGVSHLEGKLPTSNDEFPEQEQEQTKQCPHKAKCVGHQYAMKCIFQRDKCRLKHFYDKYGTGYNQLGV